MPDRARLEAAVREVVQRQFGRAPDSLVRFPKGHVHSVWDVRVGPAQVVVRLCRAEAARFIEGALYWVPRLAARGVPVPRLIEGHLPGPGDAWAWMVSERLPGCDLEDVLPQLAEAQARSIAEAVVRIQRKVALVGQGSGFGFAWTHQQFLFPLAETWWEFLDARFTEFGAELDRQGAFPASVTARARERLEALRPYLEAVAPAAFLDDATTKNVIVDGAGIAGVVDTDTLCFGDPLYLVGNTLFRQLFAGEPARYSALLEESFGVVPGTPAHAAVRLYALYKCLWQMARLGSTAPSGELFEPASPERVELLSRLHDELLR